MNYLLEHYKVFNKIPQRAFADTLTTALRMAPQQAIDYLKKKASNAHISVKWNDWSKEAHSKAFTVAGVFKADVLQEIANYIISSMQKGNTFKDFQKEAINGGLVDRMAKAGWTGNNSSRLQVIYDTNIKMAAAQGKYEQFILTKDVFPNVKYLQVERKTKRHDHSLLHNHIFNLDDPLLNIIAPPSAFRCNCRLVPTKESPTAFDSNLIKGSKEFIISPLSVWKPKFEKYSSEIKSQLQSYLEKVNKSAKYE